jgi:hypothetical protein
MVFTCKTLLAVIQRAAPELDRAFRSILDAIGTPDEQRVVNHVYQDLQPINFSKGVLEVLPFEYRRRLIVLPVQGVTWSDWGTSDRLSSTLRQLSAADYAQPKRALS